MSPAVWTQARTPGASGVVVGEGVAGAAPEGGGPEGDHARPALGVALVDGDLFDVGGPRRIAGDVGTDLETARRIGRHHHPLSGLFRHDRPSSSNRLLEPAWRQPSPSPSDRRQPRCEQVVVEGCLGPPAGGQSHPRAQARVGQQSADGPGDGRRLGRATHHHAGLPVLHRLARPAGGAGDLGHARLRRPPGRRCRSPPVRGPATGYGTAWRRRRPTPTSRGRSSSDTPPSRRTGAPVSATRPASRSASRPRPAMATVRSGNRSDERAGRRR